MANKFVRWFNRSQLPDEALDQLRANVDNYNRLRPSATPANSGDDKEIQSLKQKVDEDPQSVTWSDLAEAELCVIDLLDETYLITRLDGWRRRMAEVAGPDRYAVYMTTACDSAHASAPELRADLAECIRAVYYFYASYGIAARSRNEVTKSLLRVASGVLTVLAVIAILFASQYHGSPLLPFVTPQILKIVLWLIATSAAAVVGSVVSVQRRLQDPKLDVDPLYRFIQTTGDWFSTSFVSPVFGAVFGCLMYALLASGLLGSSLVDFKGGPTPYAGKDQAALLVLGFIAGFAEQLIPDALTRIAARALGTVSGTPVPQPAPAPTPSTGSTSNNGKQTPQTVTAPAAIDGQTTTVASALPNIASAVKLPIALPLTPEAAARGEDSSLASQANVKPDGEVQNADG
ncbi:MAG TPA: hypothetical protein VGZ02_11465 [Candidatus Baltobacteraceae bacterium]|jgi:hypothetical protein|nr:hypothetical protein [Candidatus Baltobacteraceae bacterium]